MGGFFGAACKTDAMSDVFFGTDYHSHLGTKSAGMAAYDKKIGLQRVIHNIRNSPCSTEKVISLSAFFSPSGYVKSTFLNE